ncbi:MAG: response regulator [Ekhidna sp.]
MKTTEEICILYVDDEQLNLQLFKLNFQSKYPVWTASSGEEGLKILDENSDKIIVVISDMKMPGMNGVDFINAAKRKYDNIVYFILTGFPDNKQVIDAEKDRTIYKWFSKPFNMKEMEDTIHTALHEFS